MHDPTRKMHMHNMIGTRLSLLALTASLAVALPAQAAEKPAQTGKLISVVVYKNRAQVTRSGQANCAQGHAEIGDLPSTLDAKTLRATLVGGGEVIGVTYKTEVTGPRAAAKVLQKQVRVINDQLKVLADEQQAAASAELKLSSFREQLRRVWGQQAGQKGGAQVAGWNGALDLLRQESVAASKKRRSTQVASRKLHRERRELYRQLNQIRAQQRRTTYRAKVLLKCQGRREVHLAYVVPGATWRIAYQARMDTQAGKVELIAQAIVQQGTGEDWKDVRLAVSTANLRRSNTPPTVQPMHVSTRQPVTRQKVLARRFERRKHLKTATLGGGASQGQGRGGGSASAPDPGLAMQLMAAGRITVPSDGRGIVATLSRVVRRADYAFETVPKLFPYVYHRVKLPNPFGFPMLPGPIAVYRDGGFKARTRTKLRAPGEPITLSLGIDNQLQVRRWTKEEKRHAPGTFGGTQRLVHRYLIEVGNWTKRTRTIQVLENIPVSQVKEIKVHLAAQATKPTHWNKTDGIVRYTLTIPPRGKKQIVIAYTVELPKEYRVSGYR